MYSKQELEKHTQTMVELCKELLSRGNKTLPFTLTVDGKEQTYYIDCEQYIKLNDKPPFNPDMYWDKTNNPFI